MEKYARQCIESILSQIYTDFELILVDDGAKDSTPQIIDEYAKKDERIKVVHKKNGGLVSARKAGLNVATGQYIVPVDGDDWIHTDCLLEFSDAIKTNPDTDLFCSECFYATDSGECTEHTSYNKYGAWSNDYICEKIYSAFSSFAQSQWAKAYKRELYATYQFKVDDCITIGEDESVVFPMLYSIKSLVVIDKCLYYYRYNPFSMTKNRKKEWSTEGLLARVKLFEESFDLEKYNLDAQFTAYVSHATINQCLSYFKANSYKGAKSKTKNLLNNELINKYIIKKVRITNKKEKIAKFALKYRLYFLIKLYSLFW
ncbi:MAG: glycosyltransferase family 2 protein [Oscillospiraceae bacterium]|nr:glycosyltransferase family 2 protein [Oscillospiraceae bacterium]